MHVYVLSINFDLTISYPKPKLLNLELEILNPKPHTLTLHSSQTLSPKPNLSPNPYTQNPAAQSLNPKPYTPSYLSYTLTDLGTVERSQNLSTL